jgi:hypothetical protein
LRAYAGFLVERLQPVARPDDELSRIPLDRLDIGVSGDGLERPISRGCSPPYGIVTPQLCKHRMQSCLVSIRLRIDYIIVGNVEHFGSLRSLSFRHFDCAFAVAGPHVGTAAQSLNG